MKFTDGRTAFAEIVEDRAKVFMGLGAIRFKADGGLKFAEGRVGLSLPEPVKAQVMLLRVIPDLTQGFDVT